MILSGTPASFISKLNYVLRGLDDDAPEPGTDEYTYWLSVLWIKIEELYADPAKQWSNTYQVVDLGTIAAATDPTFPLNEQFLGAANTAYIVDANGKLLDEFDIIKPQEKNRNKQQVFIAGQDPENLYFTREILETSNLIGGSLKLPAYMQPDLPTKASSIIPVPNANWALYATASEIAENDITYEDKAPNLNAKATYWYGLMAKKSTRGTYGNSRKPARRMTKIGQRHR